MNIAIILAAGNGKRFLGENRNVPKQFYEIYRKEVIAYSLETFSTHPEIDEIVVVTNFEYVSKVEDIIKKYDFKKIKGVVSGGITRQASVLAAVEFLIKFYSNTNHNVIIHDAARLMVSKELISRNIKALEKYEAVSTIVPLYDTLIESEDGELMGKTLDRSKIYALQTPQSFRFDTLVTAHLFAQELNINDSPDDCSLMKLINKPVHLVNGERTNIKLTTGDDLKIVKSILENKEK